MGPTSAIAALQQALKCLPGVGPKSAQRMAFHLLERDRQGAAEILATLDYALKTVRHCSRCNNFSANELCSICSSAGRNPELLCVLETPADLESVEQAGIFKGMYFVLMGHLSPLDGIGPDELGVRSLIQLIESNAINEIILATNLTVEGEATADYIGEIARKRSIKVTRLARGLPMGGELEYMDQGTLSQAFEGRREY